MHKSISNLSSSSNNSHSDVSRSSNCVYLPGKASVISLKLLEEGHHPASSRSVASDGLAYVVGPDTEVGGGVYDHSWFRDKHRSYESSQSITQDLLALDACWPTTPESVLHIITPMQADRRWAITRTVSLATIYAKGYEVGFE